MYVILIGKIFLATSGIVPETQCSIYAYLRGRGSDSVFAHTEKDLSSHAGRGTDYPRGA